jgi:ankyrin repeat protein
MGEIVKLLLIWGANSNAQIENGITMLHVASQRGYVKVVEALLEHNADVNRTVKKNDVTPLHIAAYVDHLDVEAILRFIAGMDSKNDGKTALHFAAQGHLDVVKILLKFSASIDSKYENGRTALHLAAERGHLGVVKILLKFGASIDSRHKYGSTPLHFAAEQGHLDTVEVLIKFGAIIDSKDEAGDTPLHIASDEGHKQTVIALLEHGSDINIVSIKNETALDVAMAHFNSIDYILECHIVKMKTANLFVSKYNLLSISNNDEISDFQNGCAEEIASMKSEKVGNTNVSFYDSLTKGISQVAMYAANESIVQVLRSDDYKVKFPIYACMINTNFRKGERRKQLLEQGHKIFHSFFNNFSGLPHVCTAEIFSYLSDKDLRSLIDVCKPFSVSIPKY